MTEIICIICPKGCRLQVDEQADGRVTGNGCPRGEAYGRSEVLHPMRIVTSTVRIEGTRLCRCPVKLSAPIPKELIFEAVRALDGVILQAPVRAGQIVVRNVCNTGANFVATRDL